LKNQYLSFQKLALHRQIWSSYHVFLLSSFIHSFFVPLFVHPLLFIHCFFCMIACFLSSTVCPLLVLVIASIISDFCAFIYSHQYQNNCFHFLATASPS
jgi:hypothetical protein